MNKWIAICAYSVDTPYEDDAMKLMADLHKYNVPCQFYPYESLGDWALNCERNGQTIIQALRQNTRDIVYLDADARVHAYPSLFDTFDYDLGFYKRWHTKKQIEQTGRVYHWDTGTMFFRNRPEIIKILEEQQKLYTAFSETGVREEPDVVWTLESFERLINGQRYLGITVGELPVTYSYIFDTKQPEEVKYKDEAVIVHHQKSRQHKAVINGEA